MQGVCTPPAVAIKELEALARTLDEAASEWLRACRTRYKKTYRNSASWNYLEPVWLLMPKGFGFLTRLVGIPNARLTEQYLQRLAQGAFSWDIELGHSTTANYPKLDVPIRCPG